jgi:hypothetical protein
LLLDIVSNQIDQYWSWQWYDMRVETTGKYTRGMSCIDNRLWVSPGGAWKDQPNVVQVITEGSGDHFNQSFFQRVYGK